LKKYTEANNLNNLVSKLLKHCMKHSHGRRYQFSTNVTKKGLMLMSVTKKKHKDLSELMIGFNKRSRVIDFL